MMAKALAGAGAKKVYILGRRKSALEKAAAQHESLAPLECDVTTKDSLRSAVEAITKETGYVNLVVANSGVYGPAESFDPSLTIQQLRKNLFENVAMEDFTTAFHVNVTGAYFTLLAFLELLDAGKSHCLFGPGHRPDAHEYSSSAIYRQQACLEGGLRRTSQGRQQRPLDSKPGHYY